MRKEFLFLLLLVFMYVIPVYGIVYFNFDSSPEDHHTDHTVIFHSNPAGTDVTFVHGEDNIVPQTKKDGADFYILIDHGCTARVTNSTRKIAKIEYKYMVEGAGNSHSITVVADDAGGSTNSWTPNPNEGTLGIGTWTGSSNDVLLTTSGEGTKYRFYKIVVYFELDVNPSTMYFEANDGRVSVNVGGHFALPALVGAVGAVTFDSSDEHVATVTGTSASNYSINVRNVGTTIIKAQDSNSQRASFELTVTDNGYDGYVTEKVLYKKITHESELESGGEYLIVCSDTSLVMGASASNNTKRASETIAKENDDIIINEGNGVPITLTKDSKNNWKLGVNGKYIYNSSGTNLAEGTQLPNNYLCKIDIDSKGNVYIYFSNSDGKGQRAILYYPVTHFFGYYSDDADRRDVQLFKKVTVPYTPRTIRSFTISPLCTDNTNWYGTIYTDAGYTMPDGVDGGILWYEDGKLMIRDAYPAGTAVDKEQALLLTASNPGVYVYALREDAQTNDWDGINMLHGAEDGVTRDEMTAAHSGEDNYYFRLTMHNGTDLGFWWGAPDGGVFDSAAGKAYLAIPKTLLPDDYGTNNAAGKGFTIGNGNDELSVDALTAGKSRSTTIYNLSGQRVTSKAKGLVIVNGKKYLNL